MVELMRRQKAALAVAREMVHALELLPPALGRGREIYVAMAQVLACRHSPDSGVRGGG